MEDTKKKWARRVATWRASGLSSPQFCVGRNFTAGGLRHWAHRLRKLEAESEVEPTTPMRLARVVRTPPTTRSSSSGTEQQGSKMPEPSLVLEMQGVRIGVPPGFDPITLASVLSVLEQRNDGGRAR